MIDKLTLPGLSDDENDLLNHLLEQLNDKQPRNLMRAARYDAKQAIHQVGSIIPPQYYRLGLVLGWNAKAVDILARRCNLDTYTWPDGDLDSIGFRETWTGNHLSTEVSSALISSLIHGPSFLVNTQGDVGNGEPAGLIHVKDALNATGDWNARARRLDNLLSITSRDPESKNPTSLALYLDGRTIVAEKDRGVWSVDVASHSWGVPAEPLVYKPRVGRPFGSSRISRPLMSAADQALRTVIRMEGHADVYSFPEMWLMGADESVFRNADGSQKAVWQVMLGRIKAIPDDDGAENPRADVKQFAASSPQPHLDQLKAQASLFAGEADLPVTALGVQAEVNTSTADGSDNAERQLIAEAEGATDDWSPALRRSLTRALAMANGESSVPDSWGSIEPKWRDPRYLSRAAQADAGAKTIGAVPWLAETTVGLQLLGLSEQQIREAQSERRRARGSGVLEALRSSAERVAQDGASSAAPAGGGGPLNAG